MAISMGDFVMYAGTGICQVEGIEKRSLKDKEVEFYRLKPCNSDTSVYLVPCVPLSDKSPQVRKLLTKEEILALIDGIPELESTWTENAHQRKAIFSEVKKCDDYEKTFAMLKSIYSHRQKCADAGKRMLSADERAMKSAEETVHAEFAFVLGIKASQVDDFIAQRIEGK